MSQLIETLKKQHSYLLETLELIKNLGYVSDGAVENLFKCKEALLAHIKLEDEQLYPSLEKAAGKDPSIQHLVDRFKDGMGSVSKKVMEFFEKYNDLNSVKQSNFAPDLGNIMALLKDRIRKEESLLYSKYDQLVSKS